MHEQSPDTVATESTESPKQRKAWRHWRPGRGFVAVAVAVVCALGLAGAAVANGVFRSDTVTTAVANDHIGTMRSLMQDIDHLRWQIVQDSKVGNDPVGYTEDRGLCVGLAALYNRLAAGVPADLARQHRLYQRIQQGYCTTAANPPFVPALTG